MIEDMLLLNQPFLYTGLFKISALKSSYPLLVAIIIDEIVFIRGPWN